MLEPLKDNLAVLMNAISLAGILYVWLTTRSRGNEKHLEKADLKIASHEERLVKLEAHIEHLPTKDGQHRLEILMEKLAGQVGRMEESQKGTRSTVDRMETTLLGGSK